MGAMAPSHFTMVTASKYSEPEKITMPARKPHQAGAANGFRPYRAQKHHGVDEMIEDGLFPNRRRAVMRQD